MDLRLFMLQRLSALVLAPFVIAHIGLMIYAIQGGISSAEILARTQGSVGWALFYGIFVIAVAIHGALGLRIIVAETFAPKGTLLSAFAWLVFVILLALGGHAVFAVTTA